ncbi:putative translation initiation factor eIF-2B subunit epsilon [Grifola frondosa]|uniref:Putative translation initiation factor eIF-2B subunit epsilon n=1 Tax=Grifola frondosa TaxID=5627 RepID=A0A1C7MCJ0_GRIFR|nr:putative translation initiation factor eIF-2B subunit epsilon [Grifola frondosa]
MPVVVKESSAAHCTRYVLWLRIGCWLTRLQVVRRLRRVRARRADVRVLHYEPVIGYPLKAHASIPREILAEHPEVDVCDDLIDCSIDICSVEVPWLFQDNFNHADTRCDFAYGVPTSDLLMKNIFCYIVKDGYAACIAGTRSYDAVSAVAAYNDNHLGGHLYEHLRGNRYITKCNSVILSRTCKIGPNTLVGGCMQITMGASVHASGIGQHCTGNGWHGGVKKQHEQCENVNVESWIYFLVLAV